MAKITPVVVRAKQLSNGKHKVRIAVAHNGETRYIATDIIIDSDKEFKNGAIVKRFDAAALNTKLRGLLQSTQNSIDNTEYCEALSCSELVTLIKQGNKSKYITFDSLFDELIDTSSASESTLTVYKAIWTTVPDAIRSLRVKNITYSSIIATEKHFRKIGNSQSTIHNKMQLLKQLVRFAINCGYADFKVDPFASYKFPPTTVRDAWLSVDEIKAIRDFRPRNIKQSYYRDMFMLSYYLGGINIADLIGLRFTKETKSIKYVRKKTMTRIGDQSVEFELPDEAREIIGRHLKPNGSIIRHKDPPHFSNLAGPSLSGIAKALGINNMIFYSARKSFSQHAFELGINTNIIDYLLGHSVNRRGSCIYHYVKVTPQMATNALRKVLDNLK